jgi:hypothetical protein
VQSFVCRERERLREANDAAMHGGSEGAEEGRREVVDVGKGHGSARRAVATASGAAAFRGHRASQS